MKIHVTTDHIARGAPLLSEQCPIALAIKEQCPHLSMIEVGQGFIHYDYDNYECEDAALSNEAQKFIQYFDSAPLRNGYARFEAPFIPQPFTFEVSLPDGT